MLFLNLVTVSENNHVSDNGVWHCTDTNIFHGPGSSLSSAEEVQISQDFDQYSCQCWAAELLHNYQQIFWAPQQINMYQAVSHGLVQTYVQGSTLLPVGLLNLCRNSSCSCVISHVILSHDLLISMPSIQVKYICVKSLEGDSVSHEILTAVSDSGFTFQNITVPYRRSIRKILSRLRQSNSWTKEYREKKGWREFERNMHRTFSLDIAQIRRTGLWGFTIVSMSCDKTVVTDCVIQV